MICCLLDDYDGKSRQEWNLQKEAEKLELNVFDHFPLILHFPQLKPI